MENLTNARRGRSVDRFMLELYVCCFYCLYVLLSCLQIWWSSHIKPDTLDLFGLKRKDCSCFPFMDSQINTKWCLIFILFSVLNKDEYWQTWQWWKYHFFLYNCSKILNKVKIIWFFFNYLWKQARKIEISYSSQVDPYFPLYSHLISSINDHISISTLVKKVSIMQAIINTASSLIFIYIFFSTGCN